MIKLKEEAQEKTTSKKPLTITVSPEFTNVHTGESVYLIIFSKPNKTF